MTIPARDLDSHDISQFRDDQRVCFLQQMGQLFYSRTCAAVPSASDLVSIDPFAT